MSTDGLSHVQRHWCTEVVCSSLGYLCTLPDSHQGSHRHSPVETTLSQLAVQLSIWASEPNISYWLVASGGLATASVHRYGDRVYALSAGLRTGFSSYIPGIFITFQPNTIPLTIQKTGWLNRLALKTPEGGSPFCFSAWIDMWEGNNVLKSENI